MGKHGPKPVDLAELQLFEERWWEAFRLLRDGCRVPAARRWQFEPRGALRGHVGGEVVLRTEKEVNIPGRPRLWQALQRARKIGDICRLCDQWHRWLDKITEQTPFDPGTSAATEILDAMWPGKFPAPEYIKQHAQEFLAAKRDRRFPRKRKTADDARLDHLARAMAGVLCSRTPATGVDRLRRIRHDTNSEEHVDKCWRCQMELAREVEKLSHQTLRSSLRGVPELEAIAREGGLLDETPASIEEQVQRKAALHERAFWTALSFHPDWRLLTVEETKPGSGHWHAKYLDPRNQEKHEKFNLSPERKNGKSDQTGGNKHGSA